MAGVLSLGGLALAVLPRPLEGDLEDARERALASRAAAAGVEPAARAPALEDSSARPSSPDILWWPPRLLPECVGSSGVRSGPQPRPALGGPAD